MTVFDIVRVRLCGHSLRTPKELRVLDGCWANGRPWHLTEAQAANDCVHYSSRSALRSQFAYPERITRPGRLLSEWWRWHLAEAQAANDCVHYSSCSALRSQFAYPERITRPGRLLSEWWRWHLAEAQAANDSVRYSFRSALLWLLIPIIVRILCAWRRLPVEF